jgi:hypothetical protein
MIDAFLRYLDSLGPFVQGVLGSAVFAIAVVIGRLVLTGARHGGKTYFRFMSRDIVLKHILHKKFVNSPQLFYALWGNFFIITQALQWLIGTTAILVTIFGIESLLTQQWLRLAGSYFALNTLIEAHSWLKDRSDEKHIAHLDPEIKAELLDKYLPKEAQGKETSDG